MDALQKAHHGERVFSFAVISDTHVNVDEDSCNSPFPVNARANRRFRHVVSDLNQRDIDFVLHLGDLVHPVPEAGPIYSQAAEAFRRIASDLSVPIYFTPGNHDIGDTPVSGAPAAPTTPPMIAAWTQEFGPQYQSTIHKGITFVMFNAQLLNSGLPEEAEQRLWVETTLKQATGRIVLAYHHPAYICTPDEDPHYDNTDPPGREWLLGLLKTHKVDLMFCGHAHNFWYDRVLGTDYYLAPATSFVRQDYSEMLRAAPPEGSEYGRNDQGKLGYFIVNIYENGHTVQVVRTQGSEQGVEQEAALACPAGPTPLENTCPLIGFDLRANWAEISEIAPSGGLDEFDRKLARNDYPLLALIEMGIRDIRIPLSDIRRPDRVDRLRALHGLGIRPTLFSFGAPTEADIGLAQSLYGVLTGWEITIDWGRFEDCLPAISVAQAFTGLPIYLSRMRSKDDLAAGSVYYHVINHGFSASDIGMLDTLADHRDKGISGAVFRLGSDQDVPSGLAEINAAASARGLQASVHFKCGAANPAEPATDRKNLLGRIEQVLAFSERPSSLRVYCDTLADVDRGYFARVGAIDPCCNPTDVSRRIAAHHKMRSGSEQ
ncbi:metallophosphoesterase family protein [Ruegeria atlantica]|uniref:metallophosphoesterase family protein n=1 Tax=Ruegeria atlantica TaxID=81569 RepID=UPI002494760C|nr:metallophosphoesterase [Ruegeria atlantica]